jgi:hypothetical protein
VELLHSAAGNGSGFGIVSRANSSRCSIGGQKTRQHKQGEYREVGGEFSFHADDYTKQKDHVNKDTEES